jgi:nitrogenase subunit NifH
VHTGEVKKETQIIAIYGKGGIGKSFTLANLSYMMAQQGKRVLLIGCDPKSDTTSLLFGGSACPTIIETSSKKKLAGEDVTIADVCFKRDGVFAMELGGPRSGRGCGGAASSTASSCSRSSASTTGASTTSCSTSSATWSAAASACRSPATCARR